MEQKDIDLLLLEMRNQIDTIDKEIVYLLSRRFKLVESIWDIKKEHSIKPLQKSRWEEVVNLLKEHSLEFGVNSDLVINIYNLIHNESLEIEKQK